MALRFPMRLRIFSNAIENFSNEVEILNGVEILNDIEISNGVENFSNEVEILNGIENFSFLPNFF